MHRRSVRSATAMACLCLILQACGDDEDDASVDAGTDSGAEAGRGGRSGGGAGGKSGSDASDAAVDGDAVTLRFKAKVGDEDLECGKNYPNQGSTKLTITPQDFRFFVEEVKLITRDGEARSVRFAAREPFQTAEVAFLDFTNGDGQCSAGRATVNTTITGTVPPGDYTGIEFVNGVPESINHQNLALAKPPLQDATTHWGWQSGYRFIMAEVVPTSALEAPAPPVDDADGGTPHGGDDGIASFVHIGSSGCEGSNSEGYTCSRPNRNRIRLADFDPESDTIVADLGKLFEGLDLDARAECHGPGPECGPGYAALGVDIATGAALDTQRVFRVE